MLETGDIGGDKLGSTRAAPSCSSWTSTQSTHYRNSRTKVETLLRQRIRGLRRPRKKKMASWARQQQRRLQRPRTAGPGLHGGGWCCRAEPAARTGGLPRRGFYENKAAPVFHRAATTFWFPVSSATRRVCRSGVPLQGGDKYQGKGCAWMAWRTRGPSSASLTSATTTRKRGKLVGLLPQA